VCRVATATRTVRDPLDQLQLVIVFKLCAAKKKRKKNVYNARTYILYYIQGDSSQARSSLFYTDRTYYFILILIFRIFNIIFLIIGTVILLLYFIRTVVVQNVCFQMESPCLYCKMAVSKSLFRKF